MVGNSAAEIIADIKHDLGMLGSKIARGVALIAFDDLKEAHRSIMASYYSGYDPNKTKVYKYYGINKHGEPFVGYSPGYDRTYNLKKNSIIPVGVHKAGSHSFEASVLIGAANMDNYINSTGLIFPAENVFDLVWTMANRGLPPGNRGHIGIFSIKASPVGIGISGSPDEAMDEFMDKWWPERGSIMADTVAGV